MFQLIKNYVSRLTPEQLSTFAQEKGINLSTSELDFLFRFVKKNYEALYANPNLDLSKYKVYFTEENFNKIMKLVREYKAKYASLLN